MRFDRLLFHDFFHIAVLLIASFLIFSNSYNHAYHLDSGHLLLENSYVRSLKFIPLYFKEPKTLTSLYSNADYRPVLQITYALNYAISKYATWSWHLFQIILHAVCVISLYFFSKKFLLENFKKKIKGLPAFQMIPFVMSLLFAIHPYTSGVINYLSARSSLLVAAFLLPSFYVFMSSLSSKHSKSLQSISCGLYALALFSKVEAIGALAVYFLLNILHSRSNITEIESYRKKNSGFIFDIISTFNIRTVRNIWLFLLVSLIYFIIRSIVLDSYTGQARHNDYVTPFIYFYTQVTAWWYYIKTWFVPVNLIADNPTYPVFEHIYCPEVLLALAGLSGIAWVSKLFYREYPGITILIVSSLALISPTSSFVPLAEMVNEHRPYLPLAILSLSWLIPLSIFVLTKIRDNGSLIFFFIPSITLWMISLSCLTYQRNNVFKTTESYYEDIIGKVSSFRAYVNYGLTFMEKGRYDEALEYYKLAQKEAPQWYIIHINLGIAYQHKGMLQKALFHFNRAVENERFSSRSLYYRGCYYLYSKKYQFALDDFLKSIPLSREFYHIYKGIATSFAGLGQWANCLEYTKKCVNLDSKRTEYDIVEISKPFWENEELFQVGIYYYQGIDKLFPKRWWIRHNIGDLASRLGKSKIAKENFKKSELVKKKNL